MTVPFYDLSRINSHLHSQLSQKASDILLSNEYIGGNELRAFENEFAKFCNTNYSIGVANGLDALFLSLKALGIGHGHEVIVPAHTFIATWLAVSRTGATIVPVDVRHETCNLNPELLQAAITNNTKVIVPVHLYGQTCEMDIIGKIAAENNLYVIEDFAQAQGAMYNNKLAGSFGIINATSFYPSKNLGAFGDAGAITTADENLAKKVRMMRSYGSETKYVHEVDGYNSRLDNLQAALLRIKLQHLNTENENRRKVAELYLQQLKGIGDLQFQQVAPGAMSIYHLFVVRTAKRDGLAQHLHNTGIGTSIHYPVPIYRQQVYNSYNLPIHNFPVSTSIAETCLSLPMFGDLKKEEVNYVCASVADFYKQTL